MELASGLSFLLVLIAVINAQDGPIVDTEYGKVQGTSIELHNGIVVNSFYGIPFAEPPVGNRRFLSPEKLQESWDGVRQTVELPSSCMQKAGGTFLLTHPTWNDFDEDCLTLNVFTPANMEGESYAVMVWLHGGAYQGSANIQYPGHFLAMKDIANFGGDPNMVTIFGQSAGGGSVGNMLMSPLATGLFHRAILESGTEMAIWAVNLPQSNPDNYIEQVAEQLECPTDDTGSMMDCLREVPARQLIRTDFNCTEGYYCLGMVPVVDGNFLPDTPSNLRLSDTYNKVPEIVMHTRDDGMIYAFAFLDDTWNMTAGFTEEEFNEILKYTADYFAPGLNDPSREEDVYAAMKWFYTPWPHTNDTELNRHQVGEIVTDGGFGATGDLQAKDHCDDAETFYMIFNYRSDGFYDNLIPEWFGVFHMMELPYVLGFPYLPFNEEVRNNSGITIDPIQYNSEDREYFEFISDLWINFAKTGNPTPYPVIAPGGKGEVTWNNFTRAELNYMYVDNDYIEVRQNYRQKEFAFWREYMRCMNFDQVEYPGADTACEAPFDSTGNSPGAESRRGGGRRAGEAQELFNDALEKLFPTEDLMDDF